MPYDPPGFDLPALATPDDIAASEQRALLSAQARDSVQADRDRAQDASIDFLKAQIAALPGGVIPPPTADPGTSAREPIPGLILLDSFGGATDDDKLTAAMAFCAGQKDKPMIGLPRRESAPPRFAIPRVPYPGFAIGPAYPKPNEQTRSGNPYDAKIAVPKTTANPNGTWLRFPAGETHNTYVAGNYEGNGRDSAFADTDSGGVVWTSVWRDLCATNFKHILGNDARKLLYTMSTFFDGHSNINNALGCSVHVGGSDGKFFDGARSNIDGKVTDAAGVAGTKFHVWFDACQKTNVMDPYITAEGDWGGVRVTGGAQGGLNFFGFEAEGRNAGAPCNGPVVSHEGGEAAYLMVGVNYGKVALVRVSGGSATFLMPSYYRASGVAETAPWIERTGGVATVQLMRALSGGKGRFKGAVTVDASMVSV